jgi:uncharacterized Zn finger protein
MARWFPPPSRPRRVAGGIKAASKRGAFGERWWAKRWISVLEGFGLGARLARGKSYARHGQVVEIAIDPDGIRAKVQGSRKSPYIVTIQVAPLRAAQWTHVIEEISRTPRFAAMLLNEEMPEDIEDAFEAAKCALFPQSIAEVQTTCSCPDLSNPCKHVAAVYYLIGEEFDRDPFLLFALRGRKRDEIIPELSSEERAAPADTQPLSAPSSRERPPLERPPIAAWLLRRAGRFPFWNGSVPLEEALSDPYEKAAEAAAALLAQTWGEDDPRA